ncbi:hypothetical protein PG993_008438 [Apiospora rasikravindrae]|uniref:Protein kinase domain-containing protein n=1 Tax=Apiospora rasikravindrae TaxID=990691 RepID=A0ABR1T0P0_9PEZI
MPSNTRAGARTPDLFDEIEESLQETTEVLGGGKFLPEETFDLLLKQPKIEAALRQDRVKPTTELIDYILSRGKRVFLTLLYSERLSLLEGLQDSGFGDDDLPVEIHQDVPGVSSLNKQTWTLDSTPLPVFADWDSRSVRYFVNYQWQFLVAKFPDFKFEKFASQHPLPLVKIKSERKVPASSGGFSNVFRLQLCDTSRSCQGRGSDRAEPRIVAVKRFNEDLEGYFHKESENLHKIEAMDPHRHLIKPIAMFQRGPHYCVMFPWASGGNLGNFWERNDGILRDEDLRASLVSWCLEQMVGMSDALRVLHNKNCRHGDLKPENLLHFEEEASRGRLVVADFGLSKFHLEETNIRTKPSSDWSRTSRYEPPEVDQYHKGKPRSRHYDLWSVGCIFLEFAIWLVHDLKYLKDLKQATKIEKFWQCNKQSQPEVHPLVIQEMDTILVHTKATSAVKDIVKLVKDRLLVVRYQEADSPGDQIEGQAIRASAEELCSSMRRIQELANGSNRTTYLSHQRIPRRSGSNSLSVQPNDHRRRDSAIGLSNNDDKYPEGFTLRVRPPTGDIGQTSEARKPSTHPQTYRIEQTIDLNDRWESSTDNDFARALFQRKDWMPPPAPTTADTVMCAECKSIDFLSARSEIPFDQDQLRLKSATCDVCAVIHEALTCLKWPEQRGSIVRIKSEFRIAPKEGGSKAEPLVLSMYADPSTAQPDVEAVAQRGYPDLPGTESPKQYEIIRAWRDNCDGQHEGCYPWKTPGDLPPMPTRVIDVGDPLRLVETSPGQPNARYVALSHCWGRLRNEEKYCTTQETIASVRERIPFDRLPKTFRDAVAVTRQLGIRYLWIDSICIIQGDQADWEAEAQKMGDVFRFAYCTLAASSAESSIKGFANDPTGKAPRTRRKVAALTTSGGSKLYLCRNIDNFQDHVEGSVLASRGWVFQERALSRRTLHFTSTQLYWECGEGVHCETLGKLQNAKAALMGDAQFPKSALQYFKGGRIILFQHVYRTYSKLAFTNWTDRAVALLGLESRLGEAFRTRAEFGVLEEYLARSLLWQRDSRTCPRLLRIPQPPRGSGVRVPSWSWMAYRGEIDYLDIPWDRTDWCEESVESPFEGNRSLRQSSGGDGWTPMEIHALACGISGTDKVDWNKGVTMDDGSSGFSDLASLRCVVVGQERRTEGVKNDRLQYVLIVKAHPRGVEGQYQRVGVGKLFASWVQKTGQMNISLV